MDYYGDLSGDFQKKKRWIKILRALPLRQSSDLMLQKGGDNDDYAGHIERWFTL